MEVYLPVAADRLRVLVTDRRLAGPLDGVAATASLRDRLGLGEEELAYALSVAAGEAAAELATAADRGRFVLVVEASEPDLEDSGDPGAVRLPAGVAWQDVTAVLADPAGDDGELGWFGAQELAGLLGLESQTGT